MNTLNNISNIILKSINEAFDFNEVNTDSSLIDDNTLATSTAQQLFNNKYPKLYKLIKDKEWTAIKYNNYILYYALKSENLFNYTIKPAQDAFLLYGFSNIKSVYDIYDSKTSRIPATLADIISYIFN